jgi:hypothetical protein
MKPVPVKRMPIPPNYWVLSQRPVSRTRDIRQDSIEEQVWRPGLSPRVLDLDVGIDGRIHIGDDECWRGQSRRLMDQKACTLVVAVVGND